MSIFRDKSTDAVNHNSLDANSGVPTGADTEFAEKQVYKLVDELTNLVEVIKNQEEQQSVSSMFKGNREEVAKLAQEAEVLIAHSTEISDNLQRTQDVQEEVVEKKTAQS